MDHKRKQSIVPWDLFAPYYAKLLDGGMSSVEIFQDMGYSGPSGVSKWENSGEVPKIAHVAIQQVFQASAMGQDVEKMMFVKINHRHYNTVLSVVEGLDGSVIELG